MNGLRLDKVAMTDEPKTLNNNDSEIKQVIFILMIF